MSTKEMVQSTRAQNPAKAAQAYSSRGINPFDLLQTEIGRVFDSFTGWPAPFAQAGFSPSMEVIETDATIEVATELPGMDEKDVEISIADGVLTIRGEKKMEKDETKKNYRLVECSYGAFERTVGLPKGVDASKVKAKMSKGVLKVEIQKPATAKSLPVKITPA